MKSCKVAILGAGGVSRHHAEAWQTCPHAELVGFVDLVVEKAQSRADEYGGIAAGSIDALLEQTDVDLVDVCTREPHHAKAAIPLVERGMPVICEKIMAHEMKAGLQMVRAARVANTFAAVQYNYRAIPGIARIRDAVQSGEYGALRHLTVIAVRNCFNHLLDTVLHICGPAREVTAVGQGSEADAQCGVAADIAYLPSSAFSAVIVTDGPLVTMSCGSTHHKHLPFHITACFEEATLQLSGLSWPTELIGELRHLPETSSLLADYDGPRDTGSLSFTPALWENARRLLAGEEPWCDWEQGWQVMLASHACMRSIERGGRIDMAVVKKEIEAMVEVNV